MNAPNNPRLSRKELLSVKKLFRLYQDRDGTIDPHEVILSMQTLKLHEKNPVIYELFEELDTPENSRNRLDYVEFVELLNEKLSDKESQKAISRIYEVFLGNSPGETLTFDILKKVCQDVGEDMTDTQIRELLERAGQNGKELTFDEFYAVMTKKVNV